MKIKMICNHCGGKVEHYKSNPGEVGMIHTVRRKYYCYSCLKDLAILCLDNSVQD